LNAIKLQREKNKYVLWAVYGLVGILVIYVLWSIFGPLFASSDTTTVENTTIIVNDHTTDHITVDTIAPKSKPPSGNL